MADKKPKMMKTVESYFPLVFDEEALQHFVSELRPHFGKDVELRATIQERVWPRRDRKRAKR